MHQHTQHHEQGQAARHVQSHAKDPVCGMDVSVPSEHHAVHQGMEFHFCSEHCLEKFRADPARFAGASSEAAPQSGGEHTGHDACAAGGDHGAHGRIQWDLHRTLRQRAGLWGLVAAAGLLVVYVGVLALANSLDHALGEFARLWYWMVPLVLGFSVQVGLFAYARAATRGGDSVHARGVAASGGTSTLSMVACCAHHLTDVLPLIGLAGAAVVLSQYQDLFLLLGVLSNVVGLVYVLGLLHKHGLYPKRSSVLSLWARRSFDRALPFVGAACGVVFVGALVAALI